MDPRDEETLARMTRHIEDHGSNFEVVALLKFSEDPKAIATATLDLTDFVFYTPEGVSAAHQEFRRRGWSSPLTDLLLDSPEKGER